MSEVIQQLHRAAGFIDAVREFQPRLAGAAERNIAAIDEAIKILSSLRDAPQPQPDAEPEYVPPGDAPEGYEWTGECRPPRDGDHYWLVNTPALATCDHGAQGGSPYHILRKLPEGKPEMSEAVRGLVDEARDSILVHDVYGHTIRTQRLRRSIEAVEAHYASKD